MKFVPTLQYNVVVVKQNTVRTFDEIMFSNYSSYLIKYFYYYN